MALTKLLNLRWVFLGGLVLFSVPAALSLILPGFYEPHDLHHFADIYQMARAISSGQIPPRFGPDFTFGYGYPLFNFYYLLPFYLGALIFFLVGSLTVSFKAIFSISVIISVLGMYLFLKEFVGKWSAVAGSLLFLYTPYRAVQIYVRGAMGEALALSLLPLVAWGLIKVIRYPKNRKIAAGASLLIFLFLLSHNYLWALSLPFLIYLSLLFLGEGWRKKLKSLVVVGILSLGTSFFWLFPALVEQKLVRAATPFPLIDHFPYVKQLIIPSWGYGSSVWGPSDGMSFQIGLVNLAVVLLALGLFIFKRRIFEKGPISRLTIWALTGFFVSLALMNIRTYPIWRLIPFHDFVQFPWRLLIFTTFFTSVLAAVAIEILDKNKILVAALIVGASILLTFSYFRPSQVFYKKDNDYLARFFANRTVFGEKKDIAPEYFNYSEDYLLLPIWADKRPNGLPASKIETSEEAQVIDIAKIDPIRWQAKIVATHETKVTFNSYYFPGWFAKIDGKRANINPGKPFGQIELIVPAGEHNIEFYWIETTLRKLSDFISISAFLLLVGVYICPLKKKIIN